MPIKNGKSDEVIKPNTAKLIKEGYPATQAYAIAKESAEKYGKKKPKKK